MAMINPFGVFKTTEIAAAINRVPNTYGRINQIGLFPAQGVTARTLAIEEQNGTLALIPTERYGGPGLVGQVGKRKVRTFEVPKLVYDEFCGPEEVHAVRAFGGSEQDNLARLLNEKLAAARAKHDITLEHLRMGALKGTIVDADGVTPIYNLFTEFGVSQISVDFLLGTAGTDVTDKCREVVDAIQDRLFGEQMSGVRALVSPEFFKKLIKHPKVEKFYLNYMSILNQQQGSSVPFNTFEFGGLVFEEYRAITSGPSGPVRFIAANEGHAFPVGTSNTFRTFVAPADFNESVGSLGQLYYAKTMEAKFGRGWDVHTQSNPLPLCLRPEVLVKVSTSN